MIQIGMLVSERYEILEKIGTGGMSDVYKARCHKLKRFVAIKVLKKEFSNNKEFVTKFRIEAQATAGLAHPNIVNVYDVGEEDGLYYIVMELVEGITLKRYIEKKSRLSVKEAISIAIQISMGIEGAHTNHIIHRDIKPQNIIISKDGKVKVADFGIAKAVTSDTITSNVMGSVHYTSPEQARGGFSDEKSDIYSLGITLFEMLTGRVPFNGDTTVAIAIKHIQEPMVSPRQYVPEIPVSLEQIVMKCTQKSPDRRYKQIGDVIIDLKKSLMYPDAQFVQVIDADHQDKTRMITEKEQKEIKKQMLYEQQGSKQNQPRVKKVHENSPAKTPVVPHGKDEGKDKLLTISIGVVGVIIAVLLFFLVGNAVGIFEGNESTYTVPQSSVMVDVIGKEIEEAKETLDASEILYEVSYEKSSNYDKNMVTNTSVAAGQTIPSGTVVTVTVGTGMDGILVRDVTGLLEAEATAMLEQDGFVVVKNRINDDVVEKGYVISQSPKGNESLERGSEVTIDISLGMEENKVPVPDVLGMTEEAAIATIEAKGLACEVSLETAPSKYALGTVSYQSYGANVSVQVGTTVRIRISIGGSNYSCATVVNAPIDYVSGPATITLTTDSGNELFNTTVSAFPVPININGISGSATGVVKIIYTVSAENLVTNPDGSVSVELIQVPQTETIPIDFTPEQD